MSDKDKTKDQLINELQEMRRRVSEFDVSGALEKEKTLFELAPDGIVTIDVRGTITSCNQSFCQLTGYSKQEIVGKHLSKLPTIMKKDIPKYLGMLASFIKSGKIEPFIFEWIHKDGMIRLGEARAALIRKGHRIEGVQIILRDITERRRAEEEKKVYLAGIETAYEGIAFTKMNGDILHFNKAACTIFGYTPAEMKEINIAQFSAISADKKRLEETVREKGEFHGEINGVRKSGESFPATLSVSIVKDDNGKPVGRMGVFTDITERKQAEDATRNAEDNYLNSLNKSPWGVLLTDRNGDILHANQAALAIYDCRTLEELKSTPMANRFTPETYVEVNERIRLRRLGEPVPYYNEVKVVQKDGTIREVGATHIEVVLQGETALQVILEDITESKQAEEALKAAEQNFRNSLNSSPLGVAIVDAAPGGGILYSNQAYLDFYGYSSLEELMSTPPEKRFTPESYAGFRERRDNLERGEPGPTHYEMSIVRKDGEIRYLDVNREDVVWDGKKQYQLFFQDITERKQAEDEIRESEEKFNRAFYSNPNPVVITRLKDGSIVDANQSYTRIMGYTREEIIDHTVLELGIWNDLEERQRFVKMIEEQGAVYDFETQFRSKSGEIRTQLFSAETITLNGEACIIVSADDITERKQMEESILLKNSLLEAQSETTIDGILVVDENEKIVSCNKRFQQMWNVPPEWLEAKDDTPVLKHVTDQIKDPEQFLERVRYLYDHRDERSRDEITAKDGRIFDRFTAPLLDEHDTYRGRIWYLRDITDLRKMEEQLVMNDRMVSIGELSSGIAHELNNPLTSVIGYSDLLLASDDDIPESVRNDLEIINREAKRTAGIVKNLLTFARKHETDKQTVDINSSIEKTLELRTYEQNVNNIQVVTNFAPDLPTITADEFRLQQVFLNIIINAEHFMTEAHGKGTLTVTTEQTGNTIRASFADDGPGISAEDIQHLFDPFFTTKEVGRGTGLGLSISYGIISEHGGRIYAESQPGQGATFTVELPIETNDDTGQQ